MTIDEGTGESVQWRQLLRLRWPLAGAIALAFAVGQLLEIAWLAEQRPLGRLAFDVVGWGLLGGLAVWLSLTWASRLERRYQQHLEHALREQQALNAQLARANSQLALLSEVNRHIAASATLDEILDAGLEYPQRLVRAKAAALLLIAPTGPVEARASGGDATERERLRRALRITPAAASGPTPRRLPAPAGLGVAECLLLPLHDGVAPVGWIELYRASGDPIPADELSLLETIAAEVAEAIMSARRRSREERAVYELERAIADERARIARDIHDGTAQSLAFVRMRVDLWRDWIKRDPERLDAELRELKTTLREQIGELRRAIFALRPVQFDELGFVGGLHRYVVEFANQHDWETRIDLHGAPPELSPELEAVCFRVVQEALTNSAKHAGATHVDVTICQADGGLQVIVRDNGRGFDPGPAVEGDARHVGLRQMRERLAAYGGHLTILSRPGAGTELRAWVPLGGSGGEWRMSDDGQAPDTR